MKTVFLFGNRECPRYLWMEIYAETEVLIKTYGQENIRFIVGHRGGFDECATVALAMVKSKYPQIKILKLIAYYNPTKKLCTLEEIDGTYYPEGLETVPKPYAIVKANNIVVDSCDAVICFVQREGSNTYKLLRRAKRKNIPVVNLAGRDLPEYKI